MNDDDWKLLGSILGLLAMVAVVYGIHEYEKNRPCSDYRNYSVRYAPLRCLPGGQ